MDIVDRLLSPHTDALHSEVLCGLAANEILMLRELLEEKGTLDLLDETIRRKNLIIEVLQEELVRLRGVVNSGG